MSRNLPTPPSAFIFDMDGTLADTLPLCIAVYQDTFRRFLDRDFTAAEITAMFGPNEEGILGSRVASEQYEAALQHYLDQYATRHHEAPAPFEGVTEMLEALQQRGARLALVTGKGMKSCVISLEKYGLTRFFDPVVAGSEKGNIKHEAMDQVLAQWGVQPSQAAYVGDTVSDIESCRLAGVMAVAAAWASTTDPTALRAANPDLLFETLADFTAWCTRG